VSDFSLGMGLAQERLRDRTARVAPALAAVAVLGSAWVEHRAEGEAAVVAADVTLGIAFGTCLPLMAYALVGCTSRKGRLDDAVRPLSRHGSNRRLAMLGIVVRTSIHVAAIGAVLGVVGVMVARGQFTSAALADALIAAWVGAIGGLAYTAWLSLGSLFGRFGGGRLLALLVDFSVGAGSSAVAAPWPRSHVRSLIGGDLVLGMPAWGSSLLLSALSALYVLLCLVRVRR
jgi:hypothetical protein